MSNGYKSRKKRVSRHELIQSVKKLQRTAIDQENRAERAEMDAERTRERIREIGFKCVDTFRGGPLEHKTIKPTPYGTYCLIADDGRFDINNGRFDINKAVEEAKPQLARSIAEMLINENLVEFIVHDHRPGDLMDYPGRAVTVGAKLYAIPWEKMAVWKDGVTVGNIREWQYGRDRW